MSVRTPRTRWARGARSITSTTALVAVVLAVPQADHAPSGQMVAGPWDVGSVTTWVDVGQKLQFVLKSPVSADEAFRDLTLITQGASETSLVLLTAVIRKDVVVAIHESPAFQVRGNVSLFDIWPKELMASGYLPGEYYLPGDHWQPGDRFISSDEFLPGDHALRLKGSAAGFLRQAGVESGGHDMLVVFATPADDGAREAALMKPLFIVGEIGLGP